MMCPLWVKTASEKLFVMGGGDPTGRCRINGRNAADTNPQCVLGWVRLWSLLGAATGRGICPWRSLSPLRAALFNPASQPIPLPRCCFSIQRDPRPIQSDGRFDVAEELPACFHCDSSISDRPSPITSAATRSNSPTDFTAASTTFSDSGCSVTASYLQEQFPAVHPIQQ